MLRNAVADVEGLQIVGLDDLWGRNGKAVTTDGPFAETKEQLGGFYLIEAKDLNDAIAVAAKIPAARTGCVEVRPVVDFSQQP